MISYKRYIKYIGCVGGEARTLKYIQTKKKTKVKKWKTRKKENRLKLNRKQKQSSWMPILLQSGLFSPTMSFQSSSGTILPGKCTPRNIRTRTLGKTSTRRSNWRIYFMHSRNPKMKAKRKEAVLFASTNLVQ